MSRIFITTEAEEKIYQAQKVGEDLPEGVNPENAFCIDDTWFYQDESGDTSLGKMNDAYWIIYDSDNVFIVDKTAESYKDYIVVEEDGNILGYLCEIDPA